MKQMFRSWVAGLFFAAICWSATAGERIQDFPLVPLAYEETLRALSVEAGGSKLKPSDLTSFSANISSGNLVGTGQIAVAEIHCHVGGDFSTYHPSMVFIFGLRDSAPNLLAIAEGGDRAHGGIKSAFITDDGQLVVERFKPNKADCNACYGSIEETTYKLNSGQLVPVSVKEKPLDKKSAD